MWWRSVMVANNEKSGFEDSQEVLEQSRSRSGSSKHTRTTRLPPELVNAVFSTGVGCEDSISGNFRLLNMVRETKQVNCGRAIRFLEKDNCHELRDCPTWC